MFPAIPENACRNYHYSYFYLKENMLERRILRDESRRYKHPFLPYNLF